MGERGPIVSRRRAPCRFYARGNCKKGNACDFVHDAHTRSISTTHPPTRGQTSSPTTTPTSTTAYHSTCVEGASKRLVYCEDRPRAQQEAQTIVAAEKAASRAREARGRALRQAREERERAERERRREMAKQEMARLTEKAREDAHLSVQHLLVGSAVTFGAGLAVRGFTTGFESCTVRVRNLPLDAEECEIRDLFTQQGVDPAKLLLLSNRLVDESREAKVLLEDEAGHAIVAGLNGIEFRERRLMLDISEFYFPDKMGYGTVRDAEVLNISWRAPSARYAVSYPSAEIARRRIQKRNGVDHFGRSLRFEVNQAPPGHSFYVDPGSVKISNLPSFVTDEDVWSIAGRDVCAVRRLPSKIRIEEPPAAARMIYDLINQYTKTATKSLLSFEEDAYDAKESKGIANYNLRFRTWEDAKEVHDFLKDRKLSFLGDAACWLRLPLPISYVITLPVEQHRAQRKYWDTLLAEVQGWNTDECSLSISDVPGKPLVRIRALGSSTRVVGYIKMRVEKIATGETVEGWHPGIGKLESDFADRVLAETGAYMRVDWKQKQISLCGRFSATYNARRMVKAELDRLSSLERMTTIPRQGMRFFLTKGLAELQVMCGSDKVHLDPASLILTTPNADNVLHAVTRLVEQSRRHTRLGDSIDMPCPICLCDVDTPVVLGCGHATCSSCLQHLVTSATGATKFPLTCMGDDAKCGTAIPIPYIQRFLTPAAFLKLLKAIFITYIAQHPGELHYCPTPDCEQVYRVTRHPQTTECPACLASVCSACHVEDGHDGLTCRESQMQRDPRVQDRLAEEWMARQGGRVRRCPRCSVLMEKVDGCNHLPCHCGAHVCWTCGRDFHADDIYHHLNSAHGGIVDVRP